ncbi:MAG: BTAD domain-containing putative transcriptional regulator [Paracoccaceae bacterium]
MIATSQQAGLRRERVAATLWSRSPEAQALTNLRQALPGIRAAFSCDDLRSQGDTLTLDYELAHTDIEREQAGSALPDDGIAEFGGPFLEGISINEPPFEEWLSKTRADCARIVRDTLFDAGNAALDAGNARKALLVAERILELDPFEEAGMRLCLKAHAANGEYSHLQRRL